MSVFLLAIGTSFWLGILTAISPCPLATNITAISYINQQISNPRRLLFGGLSYCLGRSLAYLVLGFALVQTLISIPVASDFLQTWTNILLGPILILAGMIVLDLLPLPARSGSLINRLGQRIKVGGSSGAFVLGVLFALSFCPVSAALFFGTLIPLAITHESQFILPLSYGIATALPVVLFAFLINSGLNLMSRFYEHILRWEIWLRRGTGTLFIAVGIYYTIVYIF